MSNYYEDSRLSASDIKAYVNGGFPGLANARTKEDTPALLRGRAIHSAILTPSEFEKTYILKDWDGRTAEGKARAKEAAEKGLVCLSAEDWAACIWAREQTAGINFGETEKEFYTEEEKCKVDGIIQTEATTSLWEIKTISDINNAERAFWDMAYDIQIGHYAKLTGASVAKFLFVAPGQFAMRIIQIESDALVSFREDAARYASEILDARRAGIAEAGKNAVRLPSVKIGALPPEWIAARRALFTGE